VSDSISHTLGGLLVRIHFQLQKIIGWIAYAATITPHHSKKEEEEEEKENKE